MLLVDHYYKVEVKEIVNDFIVQEVEKVEEVVHFVFMLNEVDYGNFGTIEQLFKRVNPITFLPN